MDFRASEVIMAAEEKNPYEPIPWEIVEEWKRSLEVSGRTRDAYDLGVRTFCAFVRSCGLDLDGLTKGDVSDFRDHLSNERGLSPATVSQYLAGVRSFYRYSGDRGIEDIAKGIKGEPDVRGFKKEALTPEQAARMLAAVETDTEAGKRNFAILNTMVRVGLRDVEIARANVGDIKAKSGAEVLYVHGKGRAGKDDFVLLAPEVLSPIRDYLRTRPQAKSGDPLFASTAYVNKGGRLSTRTISKIAKRALESIGLVDERYTAHSLRHTAITLALLGGATEREAQQMARHSNIATTMVYSHDINRIKDAAELKVGNVLDFPPKPDASRGPDPFCGRESRERLAEARDRMERGGGAAHGPMDEEA